MKFILFILLFFILNGYCQSSPQNYITKRYLGRAIIENLESWNVRDCGVLIVHEGKVVFSDFLNSKRGKQFNSKTIFPLASVGKHITSLALKNELKIKNVSIDSLISNNINEVYPVESDVTFRRLLNHNLGYYTHQGDFLLFDNDFTTEEILTKSFNIEPNNKQKWGYFNIGYVIAGEIIEDISTLTYSKYINEKVFSPLSMNNTFTDYKRFNISNNKLNFYKRFEEQISEVRMPNTYKYAAAGGIYTNLDDMSKWVLYLLDDNSKALREYFEYDSIQDFKNLPLAQKATHPFHEVSDVYYNLGFRTQKYASKTILYHSGGLPGLVTFLYIVPELDLGFFAVCNTDSPGFLKMLSYDILDHYLELPERNYLSRYKEFYLNYQRRILFEKDFVLSNANQEILKKNAGKYYSDICGLLELQEANNTLFLTLENYPSLKGELISIKKDKMIFKLNSSFFKHAQIAINKEKLDITFLRSDPNIYTFSRIKD